MKNMLENNHFF